jgi:hypothetical protein
MSGERDAHPCAASPTELVRPSSTGWESCGGGSLVERNHQHPRGVRVRREIPIVALELRVN